MGAHRSFPRTFDALQEIFGFTAGYFARERLDTAILSTIDLAVEELFTNMVKYSSDSRADVRIDIAVVAGCVEVTLTDYDVDRFDVTEAPDADVDLPVEQRRPGGLGLHLIRRLVDFLGYQYAEDKRESRITFRKALEPAGTGASEARRGRNARH